MKTTNSKDQWRPKTAVRLTVHRHFENEKTAQDQLRPVLTSLASLQGKVLYFIDFQLNFQWHFCPSQWQTMFLMGPIANPPLFGNHHPSLAQNASQTVFPANCHPPTRVSTLPSLKLRYGGGFSQLPPSLINTPSPCHRPKHETGCDDTMKTWCTRGWRAVTTRVGMGPMAAHSQKW